MTIDLFLTQYISEGLLGATDMECAAVTKDVSITPDNNNDSSPEEQRKQVKRHLPEVNKDDMKKKASRHSGVSFCCQRDCGADKFQVVLCSDLDLTTGI